MFNSIFSKRRGGIWALIVALAMSMVSTGRASAEDNLRLEMTALSQQIKDLLEKEKQDAIAVGEFSGPAHLPGSGALIRKTLMEELTRKGVTVKVDARNFEVKGDYRDYLDPASDLPEGGKLMGVKITARVSDATGQQVVSYPVKARLVHGNDEAIALLGVTAAPGTTYDASARNKKLQENIYGPNKTGPVVKGSRISARPNSPYAIEIRIKENGKFVPRKPEIKDGLAYVSLGKNEVYTVAVVNNSGIDAAVKLTIDGLNFFTFSRVRDSKGQPAYTNLICPKGISTIAGWHITNDKSDEFLITDYARSAAAKMESKGNVGTITVTFAAAWPKDQRPPDEPAARNADIATGRGARIDKHYELVKREIGAVREAISVRYTK